MTAKKGKCGTRGDNPPNGVAGFKFQPDMKRIPVAESGEVLSATPIFIYIISRIFMICNKKNN